MVFWSVVTLSSVYCLSSVSFWVMVGLRSSTNTPLELDFNALPCVGLTINDDWMVVPEVLFVTVVCMDCVLAPLRFTVIPAVASLMACVSSSFSCWSACWNEPFVFSSPLIILILSLIIFLLSATAGIMLIWQPRGALPRRTCRFRKRFIRCFQSGILTAPSEKWLFQSCATASG